MAPEQKRSIVNWTDEQHVKIKMAADGLGMSVPAYCKLAAIERANNDVGKMLVTK